MRLQFDERLVIGVHRATPLGMTRRSKCSVWALKAAWPRITLGLVG
jgi:hypothetical protein